MGPYNISLAPHRSQKQFYLKQSLKYDHNLEFT